MIVVSDTSPLRCLAHLGLLDLLRVLYGQVLVPPAVANELLFAKPQFPAIDVTTLPFVQVQGPHSQQSVQPHLSLLDAGEAEALALAVEVGANLVLIDERHGDAVAKQLGLVTIGTLGVLLRGKTAGHVVVVGPLIDQLQQGLGFFVSAALKAQVLKLAGE